MKKIYLIASLFVFSTALFGQNNRIDQIKNQLNVLVVDQPGLDDIVESSVSDVSLKEFIRSLGINHSLNINVSNELNQKINNNFNSARVLDVLVFLCSEYDLNIEVIGGIISIDKYEKPLPPKPVVKEKIPTIEYRQDIDFVSLDLKDDSLFRVVRELTNKTNKNVIIESGIENRKINVYIKNRPFADALDKMCFANNLMVEEKDDFYLIRDLPKESKQASKKNNSKSSKDEQPPGTIEYRIGENGLITVKTKNANIFSIIDAVSDELGINYFVYTEPEGEISLFIEAATYDEFLTYLLHGTDYSFTNEDNVYLIGLANDDAIRTTELIPLNNRTIENLLSSTGNGRRQSGSSSIGNNNQSSGGNSSSRGKRLSGNAINSKLFSSDLIVEPFPELNSFIVSGPFPQVKLFKDFIHELDQVVPVIMIEVILVDVNRNKSIQAGINMGIGQESNGPTGGTLSGEGGLNVDMSTGAINDLLQSFNSLGIVNLGNVAPNFYMSIHALETNGVLTSRSAPKLATLNSYTAVLSIGRQEFYLETKTNVNASASNNVIAEQQIWKPIDANLSVEITPVVSGSGQVTLQISVIQSSFTERSGANGPFGKVNREFTSSIRVKDGEMIILGGLEEKTVQDSGSGLPFLARIPIIKWFFGSRTKAKKKSQLNIFIRPTILY